MVTSNDLHLPIVRVREVVEIESPTCESAGHVAFFHPLRIRAPSERTSPLPVHRLMRVVSSEEGGGIMSRVGDSIRPDITPIRDLHWGIPGDLKPETRDYVNLPNRDFPTEALIELVRAGDKLVTVFGTLKDAARQIKEYNFRSMEPVRIKIERRRHMFPAIAKKVIAISTV